MDQQIVAPKAHDDMPGLDLEFGTPKHDAVVRALDARRSKVAIKGWSHVVRRVADMEKTRHFYEDLLGMPLAVAHVSDSYPEQPGIETNYVHTFFELGDGSYIAFFQFAPGYHAAPAFHSPDMYERHLAMRVTSKDDLDVILKRLQDGGTDAQYVEHGPYFFSVYAHDPDGDTVEVTYHTAAADAILSQEDPHKALSDWLAETSVAA